MKSSSLQKSTSSIKMLSSLLKVDGAVLEFNALLSFSVLDLLWLCQQDSVLLTEQDQCQLCNGFISDLDPQLDIMPDNKLQST